MAQTINVHAASHASAGALHKFVTSVDRDITDVRQFPARVAERRNDPIAHKVVVEAKGGWGNVFYPIGGKPQAQPNFRVATFDLETFDSLVPAPGDPRDSDGAGSLRHETQRTHAPAWYMFSPQLGVYEYLHQLLNAELAELRNLALSIASAEEGYQAIGALDYYQDRNTDNHTFHKDTVGSTLFVALHYLNDVELLGAEYILDRQVSGGPIVSPAQRRQTTARYNKRAWPSTLMLAMEKARHELPSEAVPHVHCETIEPHAIITFVDELIYHATPLEGSRPADYQETSYTEVDLGQVVFPMRSFIKNKASNARTLRRTVSEKQLTARNRDEHGKRRFARLWICIQPRSWTQVGCPCPF